MKAGHKLFPLNAYKQNIFEQNWSLFSEGSPGSLDTIDLLVPVTWHVEFEIHIETQVGMSRNQLNRSLERKFRLESGLEMWCGYHQCGRQNSSLENGCSQPRVGSEGG